MRGMKAMFPFSPSTSFFVKRMMTRLRVCPCICSNISTTTDFFFRLGHSMKVPRCGDRPELDAFTHMSAWLDHLKGMIGRPLQGSDPVFPSLMNSEVVQIGIPMRYTYWGSHVKPIIIASGICQGRNRDFTSHCLRRGAVQWRTSRAPIAERWTLEEIKWWGGWSSSERVSFTGSG